MNEASFFHVPWEGNEFTEPDKAKVDEARSALLALGQYRWGKPDRNTLERIDRLGDLDHLDALIKRAFQFSSWEDLVSSPPPAKLRRWWEDSSFYQMILEEGKAQGKAKGEAMRKAKEARKILLLVGQHLWGKPNSNVVEAINSLSDPKQVESLIEGSLQASSWDELLSGTPKGG